MRKRRAVPFLLSAAMTVSMFAGMPFTVMADDTTTAAGDTATYVLMDIPYSQFYAAEGYTKAVDAVSTATTTKTRAYSLTGGTYHHAGKQDSEGNDIQGVVYPVKVDNPEDLKGYTEVQDNESLKYDLTLRGEPAHVELVGKDTLYQGADYSYYVLEKAPSRYLTLKKSGDTVSFQDEQKASVEKMSPNVVTAKSISYHGRHADTEIRLSGLKEDSKTQVSGIILTYVDNKTGIRANYALRHLNNIWNVSEIGFSQAELNNVTITNIRYITQDTVRDYPVEITLKPYYANEENVKAAFTTYASASDARKAGTDVVNVTGLPSDIKNPKATVSYTSGTGRSALTTNVTENVAITIDQQSRAASISLHQFVNLGRSYDVTVTSDNYADIKASTTPVKFVDVQYQNSYYFQPVYWAAETKNPAVVSGTSETTFSPSWNVTRQDFVTFLWRLENEPKATDDADFSDMDKVSSYAKTAVAWAQENDILVGVSGNRADPQGTITREQAVTFLYRYYNGSTARVISTSEFQDVKTGKWYTDAIRWGSANDIVAGIGNGLFGVGKNTSRAEAVSFIYRAEAKMNPAKTADTTANS